MSARKIVIFGTGGLGQAVHACLENDPARAVAAFTVERRFVAATHCEGVPIIAFDEIAGHYPADSHSMLIAVGPTDQNRLRARIFAEALAMGYEIESYVDASVRVHASNRLGRGCLIFDGVSLQPFASIGDNVIIQPLAYIGHHALVESHTLVAPHAAILGRCRIGASTFVATHATISSGVTIGAGSFISAGTVVTDDLPANSVIRGPEHDSDGRRGRPGARSHVG